MLRSFKLKMALFAVCTSGLILLAFASLFLSVIRRVGVDRIDRYLTALVENQTRRPLPPGHWAQFDSNLSDLYGGRNTYRFLIKAIGRDGDTIYESPQWPGAETNAPIAALTREVSQVVLEPLPPPRPFRPGEGRMPRFARLSKPRFRTIRCDGKPWRFIAIRTPDMTLLVGSDMAGLQTELQKFRLLFAVACGIGLFLLAAGGWFLASQALRPVKILTRIAEGMTAKGLNQRIQVPGADKEFHAMLDVINGMWDRLETSFNQAARFSADAAHELKTPLTILQGQLNQALRNAPSGSDQQRTYADLLEEVQRLKSIIRKLLLLAQSDAGQLHLSLERISLTEEIETLSEDIPLLAPNLAFQKTLAPDLTVMADAVLLRQVIQNLFSNAIKYAQVGSTVECRLEQEGATAVLTLANAVKPGLTIDRDRLFDRFYRGDPSRNRRVDGNGLGLSLAREISRAHGGDLAVDKRDARTDWITFRLTWPCAR